MGGSLSKKSSSSGSNYGCPSSSFSNPPTYDYGYSDKSSSHSNNGKFISSTPSGNHHMMTELRPLSEHYYEQPMVVFPNNNSSKNGQQRRASPVLPPVISSGDERTPFVPRNSSSSSSNASNSSSMPSPVAPPSHLGIPKSAAASGSYSWSSMGWEGGKINLGSITLTVPQGAIAKLMRRDLFIASVPTAAPNLDSNRALVTPVAQCGPANLTNTLQKPIVLSLPHNAQQHRSPLHVLYRADPESEDCDWEWAGGKEGGVLDMQVDSTTVHLVTERLGAYVLVGDAADLASNHSSSGFSSMQNSPDHRPRLSPSTKEALSRLLDVPSCEGNGWRQLSEALGADHYTSFFAAQPSPSEALLSLWEARADSANDPLGTLARVLREIRREDAIIVLERDLPR